MPESLVLKNCRILIRDEEIVQFSKVKDDVETSRKDRVVVVDSSGNPIEVPELGFQERGFSNPELLEVEATGTKVSLSKAVLMYSNGYGEWNFEHWMMDVLPKGWCVSERPDFRDITFIVTNGQFENLTKEYLSLLGVKSGKIITLGEADVLVSELLEFVSYYSHPFSIEASDFIRDFRDILIENRINSPRPKKKLYLGRTETNTSGRGRYIENLPEVLKMLELEGFEFVSAGELSLSQKHDLFSNTDIVVTEIGANCLNILMSSGIKKFIQIGHRRWQKTFYSDIFEILNPDSESVCMFFETVDPAHDPYKSPEGVNVPWVVDVDRLKSEIEK